MSAPATANTTTIAPASASVPPSSSENFTTSMNPTNMDDSYMGNPFSTLLEGDLYDDELTGTFSGGRQENR